MRCCWKINNIINVIIYEVLYIKIYSFLAISCCRPIFLCHFSMWFFLQIQFNNKNNYKQNTFTWTDTYPIMHYTTFKFSLCADFVLILKSLNVGLRVLGRPATWRRGKLHINHQGESVETLWNVQVQRLKWIWEWRYGNNTSA